MTSVLSASHPTQPKEPPTTIKIQPINVPSGMSAHGRWPMAAMRAYAKQGPKLAGMSFNAATSSATPDFALGTGTISGNLRRQGLRRDLCRQSQALGAPLR